MKYLRIIDGEITYPYTIKQLYSDEKNVSFKSGMTKSDFEEWGVYEVSVTPKPTDYTKNVEEGTPILVSGSYQQVWNETDKTESEISSSIELKWLEIREQRNILLSETDWTQFQDSPITGSKLTEYQTYRQELRDITNNDNPFTLVWPTQPE
jgi:hypothetical protein